MDPLTHTLAGASLAQTRFGRVSLGTATCVIGANLPDIDAATYVLGSDLALGFRRGWTHGVLAMAVLPVVLAWVMHRIDHLGAPGAPASRKVSFARRLGLSSVAVLSHPALDWLNTYGVRLLMPFDGRWFYGDTLFIVDPWVWLILGSVVVMAHTGTCLRVAGWIALGVITTALVTGVPGIPVAVRVLWCLGLALVAAVRLWGRGQHRLPTTATWCLALATAYIATMAGSSQLVRQQVAEWARGREIEPRRIMVGPRPGDPFRRDVLLVDDRHYHRLVYDGLASNAIRVEGAQAAIGDNHPAAAAALTAPEIWGLATWSRFPRFSVEPLSNGDNGYRVTVADMRFGVATVELDADLRPTGVRRRAR